MRHDDLIAILQQAPGRDGAGEPNGEWVPQPEIWANAQFPTGAAIMRAGGGELHAGAPTSVVMASFRIWADPTVDTTQRVRHQGFDYRIKAVLQDSTDRRFAFLACERAT